LTTPYAGPGKWFYIDGAQEKPEATQAGEWKSSATISGDNTVFTVDDFANLADEMVGWYLQHNVNHQVYLTITDVDPNAHTLTVAGKYASLGAQGVHFRIYAPPGVETGRGGDRPRQGGGRAGEVDRRGEFKAPVRGLPLREPAGGNG
jgi:hypothetical protein